MTLAGEGVALAEEPSPGADDTLPGIPDGCIEWMESSEGAFTCTEHADLLAGDPMVGGPGEGIPAFFGVFFVLAILAAIAGTIWKVSTARRLAEQSGMDPGDATAMSLLTDNGLEATYVASQVRQGSDRSAGPSAADRLRDLEELRKQGLITASEYAERREVIVKSL
ncbi:SHOCT domain-containing protein [Nocardioides cavernaquae]|uniref:SHOCT domain-containing protein n=1 Tax=Nocardioides cavernaquae TaxID=2321396 RepID=A0A3A5H651_9ACTN|nr:SHOCT domain-containing protein [Nocardioides cavernaquae]RJS44905.1 hypothetical protein D4739_00695 [Nocardioides cavernaquae]